MCQTAEEMMRTVVFRSSKNSPNRLLKLLTTPFRLKITKEIKPMSNLASGPLPSALFPHAEEWYRLCERSSSVDKITISGDLAEAIVTAIFELTADHFVSEENYRE